MRAIFFPVILIVLLLALSGCRFMPKIIRDNNAAADLIRDEKPVEAMRQAGKLAVDLPFEPVIRSNLGLAMEKSGHAEKALQEYAMALRAQPLDDELKFQLLFNTARIFGEAKKIDEALQFYQKALEVRPDSEETKINIELLMNDPQGGGGGKGDPKKDQGGEGQKENQAQPKEYQQDKPYQPKPFDSKELSQQDVKNILEELKRQEEKVRAKEQKKQQKENPNGKDW